MANILDQSYTTAPNNTWGLRYSTSQTQFGISFTPTATALCTQVILELSKTNTPSGTVWVKIMGDSSGLPDNNTLATSSPINCTAITTAAEHTFTFSSPAWLISGTRYHIVLQGDYTVSTSNYISCWGTYTGGGDFRPNAGEFGTSTDTWSASQETKFYFKEYRDITIGVKTINGVARSSIKKVEGKTIIGGNELNTMSLLNDANLVSYWRFEGNSNDSKGSNNGTDTSITYAAEKFGQGVDFNTPETDYITVNDHASLDITGGFTLSGWVYPVKFGTNSTNKESFIISKGSYPDYNYRFTCSYPTADNSGGFGCGINDGAFKGVATTKTDYPNNAWYHFACVKSSSNLFIYINAELQGTTTGIGTLVPNSTNLLFGKYIGASGYGFTGGLDDVYLFNDALSATELSNIYNTQIKKYMGVSNV